MAKAWTNNKWFIEWDGPQTGYRYRLTVQPSDTTTINPVEVQLPDDCLLDFEYQWEYDKYPIGMPAAPSLDLTFRIDKCTAEFAKAIIDDPFAEHTVNLESYYNFDITCGNVFELWVAYDKVNFNKIFIGVQQVGKENTFSYDDMTAKIEVMEIGYFMLSNIPTDIFDYVLMNNDTLVHQSDGYHDWWYKFGANNFNINSMSFKGRANNYKFWFFPTYLIFAHIDYVTKLITNRLYRVSWYWDTVDYSNYNITAAYNLLGCYYKQNYTGDGSLGANLDYDKIYSLIFFTSKTDTADWYDALYEQTSSTGYGVLGLPYAIKKEYKSCWDLMRDITAEHVKYAFTAYDHDETPVTIARFTIRNIYTDDYIDISEKILIDVQLERYEVLQNAAAVSIDKVENTIDKITASNKKAKNDKSYSVNVILQNVPFAGAGNRNKSVDGNGDTIGQYSYTTRVNNTELFYYSNIQGIYDFDSFDMYRVHEKCIFPIHSAVDSDDITTIPDINLVSPTSGNPFTPNIYNAPDYYPKDAAGGKGTGNIARQLVGIYSGKLKILAETILELFSDKTQSLLTARCRLNDMATSATTNNVFEPTHELYYDLDLISPHYGMFDSISRRFTLLSAKLSKDEFVEFEAISRGA